MAMMVTKTHRQSRHFPKGFCPRDLQGVRLFYAPLQRSTDAGAIGDPTFTRATVATQVDQDAGTVDDVASGAARFEAAGYLAEGARTNLCIESEDFSATATEWTQTRATVSVNAVAAPDGNTTADSLDEDGTAAQTHQVLAAYTGTADTNQAISIFAKPSNRDWIKIQLRQASASNGCEAFFNVNTGAVGTSAAIGTGTLTSATIEAEPASGAWNGFYRCKLVGLVGSGGTDMQVRYFIAEGDNDDTFDGLSQSSLYLWGSQFEDSAAFASSYIPTAGSAVTRNDDELTFSLPGNYNEPEGTMYCEADLGAEGTYSGVPSFFKIGRDAADYHAFRETGTADVEYRTEDGNVAQAAINTGGADPFDGSVKRLAAAWKVNDFELVTDGVSRSTDTSGSIGTPADVGGDGIQVGNDLAAGSREAWCHVRNVQSFLERLSAFNMARIR